MPPEKITISDYPVKPRRTRGTAAHRVRNRVAASVLAVASLLGIGYAFLPSSRKISNYMQQHYSQPSEEYKKRKNQLAPFSVDGDLTESQTPPQIFDSPTPAAIQAGMLSMDPRTIKPSQ